MSLTKVNLLHHFNNGNININFGHALNGAFDDLFEIFDDSTSASNMVVLNSNEEASFANFDFNIHQFTGTPQFSVQKVVLSVGVVLTGKLIFNQGRTDEQTVNWDTGRSSYNTANINLEITDFTPVENLHSLNVTFDTYDTSEDDSDNDVRLYELAIYIGESTSYQSKRYEFNDSVLTTKAWNSSRYDGRQLSGSGINKYLAGDISYGATPVVRNLTRTFYISTDVISLSNDGYDPKTGDVITTPGEPHYIEDSTLQYIPEFSYVLVNKAVTVNRDNSIQITDISTFNSTPGGEGVRKRKGFDREFQTNIPNGSYVGISNLDADIKDRTDTSYRVYFNAGRLQPLARFIETHDVAPLSSPAPPQTLNSNTNFQYAPQALAYNQAMGGEFEFLNRKRIRQFYTGSILSVKNALLKGSVANFFSALMDYRDTDPSNPRIFLSFLNTHNTGSAPSANATDIEVIRTVSAEGGYYPTENLAELSTIELNGLHVTESSKVGISSTFGVNQTYRTNLTSPTLYSGSYDVSYLNENKPALLVNLNKEDEFPDGIGTTPLVIIPENLHPYIKDNIPTFMAQAGFDIGNITQINQVNETNINLS